MTAFSRFFHLRRQAIDPLQEADHRDQPHESGWRPGLKSRVLVMLAITGFSISMIDW